MFLDMLAENTYSTRRSYGSGRVILRLFLTFLALIRIMFSGRLDNPLGGIGIISTTATRYLDGS